MTVYLVGAGPGDPGLLTVRAAELLRRADVVIYDRLSVSPALELAPDRAELINVGKQSNGPSTLQDDINDMLVRHGRNAPVVIRLKGGDPFVFARGGEEAAALAAARVEFEVVPGISAAIAAPAYAGIPVTQRHSSTSLTIVTGHEDATRPNPSVDWRAIAALGGTIVILMGVGRIRWISEELIAGGLSRDTPASAVRWGTRPAQATVRSTLGSIADADLEPPSTIVVGEVAALSLDWFETLPLHGLAVVVTRAADRSAALDALLLRRGAHVVSQPAIATAPPPDGGAALEQALGRIADYDWLIATSGNAVDAIMARLRDARALAGPSIAVVGSATAARFRSRGIEPDLVSEPHTAEALASALERLGSGGTRALFVRAEQGREVVDVRLSASGWEVDSVAGYETVPLTEDLDSALISAADVVTFTSPSTVSAVVGAVGVEALPPVVVSIGPVTTAALRALDVDDVIEADPHTGSGMVAALEQRLSSDTVTSQKTRRSGSTTEKSE